MSIHSLAQEFNTFAFGNEIFTPDSTKGIFNNSAAPTSLSVDTSFLNDWASNSSSMSSMSPTPSYLDSSSPMSSMPTTPNYMDSPSSANTPLDSFSNEFNFDAFDDSLPKSFDVSNLHVYSGDNMCVFNQHCSDVDGQYISANFTGSQFPLHDFPFENAKPGMHLDMNFSAFMESFAM